MNAWKTTSVAVVAFVLVFFGGCTDNGPGVFAPSLGSKTVTKYVAIGNSLTAGYQSNGLYQSAQIYSYPNLIAGQLKLAGATLGTFEQPLYSDPGTPGADGKASRYEIISLVGPVIGPRGLAPGSPLNLSLARPYDNLGIPGAVIFDFLDSASFASKAVPPRSNPLFALILRSAALGNSVFAQAKALHPDLVTFWLGNNDVLGYATSGGVSPAAPTSLAAFTYLYSQAVDSLRAALPNASIVVANIPDVTTIAFFTTLGPHIAAAVAASGAPFRYQKHGETGVASGNTTFTEATPPLICLTGSAYAPLLGQPTGKWYRDKGYPSLPAGIDTTKPFGFHPQNPWPDALVLDADEQAVAATAVAGFNSAIATAAQAKNAVVVDINAFFAGVKANGYFWAGEEFTSEYVKGGLFSLDGVHPSSRGSGVLANQFIKKMNERLGTKLSYVDISALPGIPAGLSKEGNAIPIIPPEAFQELELLWGSR
jgi:lysophospholipase L1-like esterase